MDDVDISAAFDDVRDPMAWRWAFGGCEPRPPFTSNADVATSDCVIRHRSRGLRFNHRVADGRVSKRAAVRSSGRRRSHPEGARAFGHRAGDGRVRSAPGAQPMNAVQDVMLELRSDPSPRAVTARRKLSLVTAEWLCRVGIYLILDRVTPRRLGPSRRAAAPRDVAARPYR